MDRLRKNIINLFKQHAFQIANEINLKITDFFGIYLDLENDKFYIYKKPNGTPLYVHRQPNHPLNILKQLLKMTSERFSNICCNENEFIKASDEYQNVLKNSGFKDKLIYTPCNQLNKRQRNREIIWYNPPSDFQVKTNIEKLEKKFTPHHRLHKVINRLSSLYNKNIIQECKKPQNM